MKIFKKIVIKMFFMLMIAVVAARIVFGNLEGKLESAMDIFILLVIVVASYSLSDLMCNTILPPNSNKL